TFSDLIGNNKFLFLSICFSFALILPLIPSLIYVLYLFSSSMNGQQSKSRTIGFYESVIAPGLVFFCIQILLLLVTGSNEFFILKFLDGEAVVNYQVYYKLYSIVLVFFSTLCIPFWGYLRKSYLENDKIKMIKYTKYVLLSLFVSVLLALLLVLFDDNIFTIWIGDVDNLYSSSDSLYMAFYVVIIVLLNLTAVFTNSFGMLKYQVFGLFIAFILKVVLCFSLGIESWSGIVLVTSLCLIPCLFLQVYCLYSKINLGKYYV
ncbi:hypothetical protein, partial [Shewanella schlegeliana]